MLVCSIKEKNTSLILKKLKKAKNADLIELRLDGLKYLQIDEIKNLIKQISKPVIFTLRPKRQMGEYEQIENERIKQIESLLELQPDFFDVEYDVDRFILQKWKKKFPNTKFVLSYHSKIFPKNLNGIFQKMISMKVFGYKIAVLPSSFDELDLFYGFALKNIKKHRLSAIAMGDKYSFFRLLMANNLFNYAVIDNPVVKGQMTLDEALYLYRIKKINEKTKFYALIGHPINKSIGHIFHNQCFFKKKYDAVYVKISVLKEEMLSFMRFAKKIFSGFSITSPLKETAMQYVDKVDKTLFSINTAIKKEGKWIGFNTDILAASSFFNKKAVKDKKIAILGGGGAAKAIALALKREKIKISFFVRDIKKIMPFVKENGFFCFLLSEKLNVKIDVLINTIPIVDRLLINEDVFHPEMSVMDIVWPENETTGLIEFANKKKCMIIDAFSFFYVQAKFQQKLFVCY